MSTMPSPDTDENVPRKRARTATKSGKDSGSDDANSGSKKQRGRPRVDTRDETAADRRRTQIRLAQRAYRLRKETTISSLKKRVAGLQDTIDQMHNAFLQFNDKVIDSGEIKANTILAHSLKETTQIFISLARANAAANEEFECEDLQEEEEPKGQRNRKGAPIASTKETHETTPLQRPEPVTVWGYTQTFSEPTSPSPSVERLEETTSVSKTINHVEDSERQYPQFFTQKSLIEALDDASANPRNSMANMNTFNVQISNDPPYDPIKTMSPTKSKYIAPFSIPYPLTRSPSVPYTYSFHEMTFARRLQRAALESGFYLVAQSNIRPERFRHVFKLSLLHTTPEQLLQRFRYLLTQTTAESLEFYGAPFFHLGGAGTHYPQRDASGNILPRPNSYNVRAVGPWPISLARLERTDRMEKDPDIVVDIAGLEGEWFDAHDVEGYLREEKGIIINPQSSFAQAEIQYSEPWVPESLVIDEGRRRSSYSEIDFSTTSSASQSVPGTPGFGVGQQQPQGIDSRMGPSGALEVQPWDAFAQPFDISKIMEMDSAAPFETFPPETQAGYASGTSPMPFFGQNEGGINMQGLVPVQKKTVTIDVGKMINELIKRGVCLGRAPGFRRKDVDKAFRAAIIPAF
ncbi:hypothetical protein M501DRAFT_784732 [Patellaria atrata CBS 101060]|uniref:BZIP domain-containing protein n=1 Tax=Patellaria atrata CBS 101060 TaxID=1346257 RepID=A0A9P4VQ09_9PEZI|nr:hypothetical protein M501DRAFT_784732 [Patellaria atrata CBS 101060]